MKILWRENKSLTEIAKEMGRHEMEIAVLIMDQGDKQRINKRPMHTAVMTRSMPMTIRTAFFLWTFFVRWKRKA